MCQGHGGTPTIRRSCAPSIALPMIDLHCHILPGIDDGPATIDESVALARAAVRAGTKTIVATPHVSRSYPNDPGTIQRLATELNARLDREHVTLDVLTGAEVAMPWLAQLDAQALSQLTLGGGSCLLIEPPFSTIVPGFDSVVLDLMQDGYRVLVAHPERCPAFQRDPSALSALINAGALTSITAGSLAGHFGAQVRRFATRLVKADLVHNVASDAHDAMRRQPGMASEIKQAGLEGLTDWLTQSVPAAILSGAPIPQRPGHGVAPSGRARKLVRRMSGF